MSRGVLMYAHNNTEIDYIKIACANALMVRKNLQVPCTLVTDEHTVDWGIKSIGKEFIDTCFDQIIVIKSKKSFDNLRNYADMTSSKVLQFYNCNHWEACGLSPYDETLFIDADYLIMSDALSKCWGSNNEIMIDNRIFDPGEPNDPYCKYIDDFGIKQYWATVIYFKKSLYAEFLFNIVQHIQDNYEYYRQLYYFSNGMFRNDNAFSIAIHMMNGFSNFESSVTNLPITGLLMSWDTHDIKDINGINDITLYAAQKTPGNYTLVRLKDQDVHIMNKWSINRHADTLIGLYK